MSTLPKVVCIGAGNVASHIIPALFKAGNLITQVYSRNHDHAYRIAIKVDAQPISDLDKIDISADIYLIMVNDDAIAEVTNLLPPLSVKQILCHTSGGTPTNLLADKSNSYGSFYPLETFKKDSAMDMSKVPFLIYGSNDYTTRTLRMVARQISSNVSLATDAQREKYHMSAVFLNNFTTHLVCLAQDYLLEQKLDPKILDAILETTFERMLERNVCDNQTGPALRNDIIVENRHKELLHNNHMLKEVYQILSSSIKAKYHKKEGNEDIG